jgi:hypothetical protein
VYVNRLPDEMTTAVATRRSSHLLAAALGIATAAGVAFFVLPPVRSIWVPNTVGAGGSIPAFLVSVAWNLIFAALVAFSLLGRRSGFALRGLLTVVGIGAIVQALAFVDAERAFSESPLRSEMGSAIAALRALALADAIAGLLVIEAAVRGRPGTA